jgi:hypothetical protein
MAEGWSKPKSDEERARVAGSVEHMWFKLIPAKERVERRYIDSDLLKYGELPLERVVDGIERIVEKVSKFSDGAKAHFEKRVKEWYPAAAPVYEAYIKRILKD